MILKCLKTNKLLFSEEEAKEHAEAFKSAHFEEVSPDTLLFLNKETGKFCFSSTELDQFCRRTGLAQSEFESVTLTDLQIFLKHKKSTQQIQNHPKVCAYASPKLVAYLVDVKGYALVKAQKALWFVKNESAEAALAWLLDHKQDADFGAPICDIPEGEERGRETQVALGMPEYVTSAIEGMQTVVDELSGSLGYSLFRAQKAVFMTRTVGTVAAAVDWLVANENAADLDTVPRKPLTSEEAKREALALQKRLREERARKDAETEREREAARIEQTKRMLEAKERLEEQERLRAREERERLKAELIKQKAQVQEQVRLDYIERFGKEPPSSSTAAAAPSSLDLAGDATGKPRDRLLKAISLLGAKKTGDAMDKNAACLNTVKAYVSNLAKAPTEPKYRKIPKSSKAFVERVASFPEALVILRICGFEETEDAWEVKVAAPDAWLLGEAVRFIDIVLAGL